MQLIRALALGALSLLALPAPVRAQAALSLCEEGRLLSDLSGPREAAIRLAELDGGVPSRARTLRRGSDDVAVPLCEDPATAELVAGSFRAGLAPVDLRTEVNTGYADDRDNGVLWAGRGVSAAVGLGAYLSLGPLSAGFQPIFTFQQNASFTLRPRADPSHSPWSHGLYGDIDLPQRMGPDANWRLDAGGSYVRLDLFGVAGGYSNENLWIGPAGRYPILMSNTAAGFPHAFVGTSRPIDLWLLKVDAEMLLGTLSESNYFDALPENDENQLSLWSLSVSPRFFPGLEIGAARAYMFDSDTIDVDFLDLFRPSYETNLEGNELASVYARWLIPASGTEIYAELARDDRYATIEDDLITEPDHSQAYMLGFQQLATIGGERIRLHFELAHLQEQQETRPGRPLPIYYTHAGLEQGYTQRGQLLGASIGPGADAQFLGLDVLREECVCGAFIERVRRNTASPAAIAARAQHPWRADTELTAGVRGFGWWRGMQVGGTLSYSKRWNRDYIENDSNIKLTLDVRWLPLHDD